jgi:hypothetical protein
MRGGRALGGASRARGVAATAFPGLPSRPAPAPRLHHPGRACPRSGSFHRKRFPHRSPPERDSSRSSPRARLAGLKGRRRGRHSPGRLYRRPRFCWLGSGLPVPTVRGVHNPPNNASPENIAGLCVPGTENPPHAAPAEHIGGLFAPRHGRRPDATEGAVGPRQVGGATPVTRRAPLAPPRVRGPARVEAPLRRSLGTGAAGAVGAT